MNVHESHGREFNIPEDSDYVKILILEEPISSFWPRPESTTSAEIVSYEPSRVVVQTQSSSQKILFISDNYYPGWKAFVGGHQTKIYRANYSFRAVSLPAGDHQVVFQYDPWSFKIGVITSVVSLFILLVCLKRFSRT